MVYPRISLRVILSFLALLYFGSGNSREFLSSSARIESVQPEVADSAFTVFDGTRFRNKPDMSKYGFVHIEVVYAMRMWAQDWKNVKKDLDHLPSKKLVYKWAHRVKQMGSEYAVIDIEHWPHHGKPEVLNKSLSNYSQVVKWYKEAEPDLKVGYFGLMPLNKRYMSSPPNPRYFQQWKENNDKLASLANKVDAFFPYLYTYSKDRQEWVNKAKYTIEEARRYNGNKPVYVFLWPQYYGIENKELKDVYIDKDFWRLQLETARKYADGLIIWFPYKTRWREASRAPWWEVTKNFLKEMGKGSTS